MTSASRVEDVSRPPAFSSGATYRLSAGSGLVCNSRWIDGSDGTGRRYILTLNDGSLLNDDEQAIYSSMYEYGHTGWLPGYYSIARYHEDIDTVVIQFVNTTGGDTWGISNVTGGKALGISDIIYNRVVRILHREINIGE